MCDLVHSDLGSHEILYNWYLRKIKYVFTLVPRVGDVLLSSLFSLYLEVKQDITRAIQLTKKAKHIRYFIFITIQYR